MTELAAFNPLPNTGRLTPASATPQHPVLSDKLAGVWAFIFIECATFSAYFIVYLLYRMNAPEAFDESQAHLNPSFGLVNTLILLTSSWQVARGVHSVRAQQYAAAFRQALLTVALGAVFVVFKLTEWYLEITGGHTFETNDFFSFYFFLTGIHVIHVLIGFVFMSVGMYQLRETEPSGHALEVAAIYWHMVDFLWVFIFALLYVMR